jgi:hypothetical protein
MTSSVNTRTIMTEDLFVGVRLRYVSGSVGRLRAPLREGRLGAALQHGVLG